MKQNANVIEETKKLLSIQSDAELARILTKYSDKKIGREQVHRAKNNGMYGFATALARAILDHIKT